MRVLLSGVSRRHGAATILSDVSLALPAGARVGVVGPNGVGKSTLLRLLAGIDEPDAGRVEREPADARRRATCRRSRSSAPGETAARPIARRTGVAAAERRVSAAAARLARRSRRRRPPTRGARPVARARRRPTSTRASRRCCAELGLPVAEPPRGDAVRRQAARASLAASCSRASTSCCSTSRRTTSTSTGWPGWSDSLTAIAARSSSSPMTGSSSTVPSSESSRSSRVTLDAGVGRRLERLRRAARRRARAAAYARVRPDPRRAGT